MPSRRGFLGWSGLVGLGVLAHHKPGHQPGPTTTTLPATTTTVAPTTTAGPTTTGPAGDADVYSDSYAGV